MLYAELKKITSPVAGMLRPTQERTGYFLSCQSDNSLGRQFCLSAEHSEVADKDGPQDTRCDCYHRVQCGGRPGRLLPQTRQPGGENSLSTPWFYVGFTLYASTAFGWVFVMKHLKLGTISVLYSVSMVVLLTAVGVVIFRETLNYAEVAGLIMAIGSMILLVRFA